MRRKLFSLMLSISALGSCTPGTPRNQPERSEDEAAVLVAVEQFFETMTANDSAGARAVLDPAGSFVSVRWNEDGERVVRRAPNDAYLGSLATESETYLERMWDPEVRIHGPIATVWTPYDFYVDGVFSHCGVDAFQLLRTDAGWLITGGMYTVERTECPESPLGPPIT